MELIEKTHKDKNGAFFEELNFELMDNGVNVCHLMVMVTEPGVELDLTVMTSPLYYNQGYATAGIKMLIEWGIKNGYKKVRMTNIFGAEAINKIARKLHFSRQKSNVWTKNIVGPLAL